MGELQAGNPRHPNEFAAIQPSPCDQPRTLDAGERRPPIPGSMLCGPKLPPLGNKNEFAVNRPPKRGANAFASAAKVKTTDTSMPAPL
jgi:hypothetical protein